MSRILILSLLSFAACQGPSYASRPELPPRIVATPPAAATSGEATGAPTAPVTADNPQTQQWLQQEIDRAAPPAPAHFTPPVNGTTNEQATQQWLQQQIEERNARNPEQPPAPIYQTVEHTTYVDRPVYSQDQNYDDRGQPVYGSPYYGNPYYGHPSTFPVHTAIGAGMGAIIGNQFHHQSGQGAAIGAGVGLLLDLFAHH
jgi:hypothetical protein